MNSSKDRILDSAERVVLRDGAAHLTLDAVAAEAALSKGGVLYHFPAKDDLIRGMVARLQQLFEAEMTRVAASDPCPNGRNTRAYLHTSLSQEPSEFCIHAGQLCATLLAAVAEKPALLEPMHERGRVIRRMLHEDGIDPVIATIVMLAADGLWLAGLFGAPPLEPELRARVLAKLDELTRTL